MKTNTRADSKPEMMETLIEDKALDAALERRPAVTIPANFTARIMERLPEGQPSWEPSRVGDRIAYALIAAVALTLLLLAGANPSAFTAGKGFAFVLEMMLVGELMAVACWLGVRKDA